MDATTLQAIVALLTLLVLVIGGLLTAVWRQVSLTSVSVSNHQIFVAREYVTKAEHDRRIDQEMKSIKEMILRVEGSLERLIEQGQKDRSAA